MSDQQLERFLRINDVVRATGIPKSTIREKAAEGKFPKSVRISPRLTAWRESEIIAWQKARIAERDAKAA